MPGRDALVEGGQGEVIAGRDGSRHDVFENPAKLRGSDLCEKSSICKWDFGEKKSSTLNLIFNPTVANMVFNGIREETICNLRKLGILSIY